MAASAGGKARHFFDDAGSVKQPELGYSQAQAQVGAISSLLLHIGYQRFVRATASGRTTGRGKPSATRCLSPPDKQIRRAKTALPDPVRRRRRNRSDVRRAAQANTRV
ncbi:MAG: hypothetical protein U1E25_05720 [Methylocystis sp.]